MSVDAHIFTERQGETPCLPVTAAVNENEFAFLRQQTNLWIGGIHVPDEFPDTGKRERGEIHIFVLDGFNLPSDAILMEPDHIIQVVAALFRLGVGPPLVLLGIVLPQDIEVVDAAPCLRQAYDECRETVVGLIARHALVEDCVVFGKTAPRKYVS